MKYVRYVKYVCNEESVCSRSADVFGRRPRRWRWQPWGSVWDQPADEEGEQPGSCAESAGSSRQGPSSGHVTRTTSPTVPHYQDHPPPIILLLVWTADYVIYEEICFILFSVSLLSSFFDCCDLVSRLFLQILFFYFSYLWPAVFSGGESLNGSSKLICGPLYTVYNSLFCIRKPLIQDQLSQTQINCSVNTLVLNLLQVS